MGNWILQLGRQTDLCRAELEQVAALHGLPRPAFWDHLAGWDLPAEREESIVAVFEELGGTMRAVQALELGDVRPEAAFDEQTPVLPDGAWAVSSLSFGLRRERERVRESLRRTIANREDARGREVRVAPGEDEVVSAKVSDLGLADRGAEVCLWKDEKGRTRIGVTRWVYSTKEYTRRDMEKPYRPQRRGLLPAKLARQMVNLARTPGGSDRLLDPFCGSGVVLLEGLCLGMTVNGGDNREDAIKQTKKNLEWFLRTLETDREENVDRVERMDARQISTILDPLSLDSVVGEGDLGPPVRGKLTRKSVAGFLAPLENLYTRAFSEIRTTLRPGGRVCLAVPFWAPNEGELMFLRLAKTLDMAGYRPVIAERGFDPLLYRRKDQRVGRAIYLLESPV